MDEFRRLATRESSFGPNVRRSSEGTDCLVRTNRDVKKEKKEKE
jgi:hypothetical protein